MDGHDYEYLIARYLKSHGYTGTKVTKGSGDFGVDVIAHKGSHKYAVQCKYYSSPVGVSAVQEAVAGKAYYGCDSAMVVTNSTFTKAARELARVNKVVLLEGITSAGAGLKLPKPFKTVLILAYLFIAVAGISAAVEVSQGQPAQRAAYNIGCMVLFVTIPIWGRFVIKGLKSYFAKRKLKDGKQATRMDKTVQAQPQVIQTPQSAVNADIISAYLKLDYGEEAQMIAQALAASDHISVSVIQRRCKYGYNRAVQLMDDLTRTGLVIIRGLNQYEWSENAKRPSYEA